MVTLEFFLQVLSSEEKKKVEYWGGSGKNWLQGKLSVGFCSSRGPGSSCFSGCSGYYEKTLTKYVCSEARHLNMCFNASSSLPFWTQTSQLLCIGMCICNRLWRAERSGCKQRRRCFAALAACRCPGCGCLWVCTIGNRSCETVASELLISMVFPNVSVLCSFYISVDFPVLEILECSTRLRDKAGEMVIN